MSDNQKILLDALPKLANLAKEANSEFSQISLRKIPVGQKNYDAHIIIVDRTSDKYFVVKSIVEMLDEEEEESE